MAPKWAKLCLTWSTENYVLILSLLLLFKSKEYSTFPLAQANYKFLCACADFRATLLLLFFLYNYIIENWVWLGLELQWLLLMHDSAWPLLFIGVWPPSRGVALCQVKNYIKGKFWNWGPKTIWHYFRHAHYFLSKITPP